MVIDVISYSNEQFAALTSEQILEVRSVQLQVNELRAKKEKIKADMKFKLSDNGVLRSSMALKSAEAEILLIDQKIDNLREGLLFYLQYVSRPSEGGSGDGSSGTTEAPYTVDYSLPYDERYFIVRDYYESAYTDPHERFQAFCEDKVALVYLGEFYNTLYDWFLEDTL